MQEQRDQERDVVRFVGPVLAFVEAAAMNFIGVSGLSGCEPQSPGGVVTST